MAFDCKTWWSATDLEVQGAKDTQKSVKDNCHIEKHAEYDGDVVKWGAGNYQGSAEDCCRDCQSHSGCNVWVWCASEEGCGSQKHGECWLKRQGDFNPLDIRGGRPVGHPWTSGALYEEQEKQRLLDRETARLLALKQDPSLPLVYMDVAIKGKLIGRVEFVLFNSVSPLAAENFRALCTGEKGIAPATAPEGAGKPYHFKGNNFYRIIDRFICQAGAMTDSVYGGTFKDDQDGLKLKHNRKGLLSMANIGPDTNGSHFSIMMGPAPHLDGKYVIFGEVVGGWEVVEQVNALSRGMPDNTATAAAGAVIVDSGQLRAVSRQ